MVDLYNPNKPKWTCPSNEEFDVMKIYEYFRDNPIQAYIQEYAKSDAWNHSKTKVKFNHV